MGCLNVNSKCHTRPIAPTITCKSERIKVAIRNVAQPMTVFTKDPIEHIKAACLVIANEAKISIASSVDPFVVAMTIIGGNVNATINMANKELVAIVSDVSSRLKTRCSVICSINDLSTYLNVSPEEIQWITEDVGVVYNVESNTNWIVVTY